MGSVVVNFRGSGLQLEAIGPASLGAMVVLVVGSVEGLMLDTQYERDRLEFK